MLVGLSVTGPSLRLAVVVPLNTSVALPICEEFEAIKAFQYGRERCASEEEITHSWITRPKFRFYPPVT